MGKISASEASRAVSWGEGKGGGARRHAFDAAVPWYGILLSCSDCSNVFMLTDSRYCLQYRALSISRTYNSGNIFQNTDFQQSIKISLRDLLLTPQLQEEEKCACHLFQTKKKNSKYGTFLILSRDKLRSHLQSDWVINRPSKGTVL